MYEERGDSKQFYYSYDGYGHLSCIRYYHNGTGYVYYVQTNSRGDVEALYLGDGSLRVRYLYDSWGNTISIQNGNGQELTRPNDIANLNPFRYRGYYLDSETGLYYLHNRYYDPQTCRFLNADTTDILEAKGDLYDKNLFAYCDNNPVARVDYGGEFWNYVIGGVVGAVVGGVSAAVTGGDWKAILLGAGVGAIGGLLGASGIPTGFQIAVGGLLNGGSNLATQTLIEGKSLHQVDWSDVALDTAIGAGSSVISYGVTKKATAAAEVTIQKGINKIVTGKNTLASTTRYGKGTIKKGIRIMRSGVKSLNTARAKSSVIGSFLGGFATTIKNFVRKLFDW